MSLRSTRIRAEHAAQGAEAPPAEGAATTFSARPRGAGSTAYWLLTLGLLVFATLKIAAITADRTGQALPLGLDRFAEQPLDAADLRRARLTERPGDWPDRETAKRHFFAEWCDRPDTRPCPETQDSARSLMNDPDFLSEFHDHRRRQIAAMKKAGLSGGSLRGADFGEAILSGARLTGTDLRDADFSGADLETATLAGAPLDRARFDGATLRNADITLVFAEAAQAVMQRADLDGAVLRTPNVDAVPQLDLRGAVLDHARLSGRMTLRLEPLGPIPPRLVGTNLSRATLMGGLIRIPGGADATRGAVLVELAPGTDRFEVISGVLARNLQVNLAPKAQLAGTAISGTDFSAIALPSEDGRLNAALLARVFRNSFGDASVILPQGMSAPCHWLTGGMQRMDMRAADFLGAWRAWLERGGQAWPPFGAQDETDLPRTILNTGVATYSATRSRPDLLPPEDLCNWERCDCEAVAQWRGTAD